MKRLEAKETRTKDETVSKRIELEDHINTYKVTQENHLKRTAGNSSSISC